MSRSSSTLSFALLSFLLCFWRDMACDRRLNALACLPPLARQKNEMARWSKLLILATCSLSPQHLDLSARPRPLRERSQAIGGSILFRVRSMVLCSRTHQRNSCREKTTSATASPRHQPRLQRLRRRAAHRLPRHARYRGGTRGESTPDAPRTC